MNFFIWRKNNVSFLRYLDNCVFVCDIMEVTLMLSLFGVFFFWSTIKMKPGQILVFCNLQHVFHSMLVTGN